MSKVIYPAFWILVVSITVATALQCVLLWKISTRHQALERLGEINGLFPKGPPIPSSKFG